MIEYVVGDCTDPTKHGKDDATKIIAHICNDRGGWGSGFVLALSAKWPKSNRASSPEYMYRQLTPMKRLLGMIQTIWVEDKTFVCNMIAQSDTGGKFHNGLPLGIPNVNYSSLYECLLRLRAEIDETCELHCPRFGAGLGGGDWNKIESIVEKAFEGWNGRIFVYDLPLTQEATSVRMAA